MALRIYFNYNRHYVEFIIDPDFYKKYGNGQYGLCEIVGDEDAVIVDGSGSERYAVVYLPDDLSEADFIGTVAHEVSRVVDSFLQTKRATMTGEIVTEFWKEYIK